LAQADSRLKHLLSCMNTEASKINGEGV